MAPRHISIAASCNVFSLPWILWDVDVGSGNGYVSGYRFVENGHPEDGATVVIVISKCTSYGLAAEPDG